MNLSTATPAKNLQRLPMVRLEEICSLITDGTHQTPTYSEEGTIFLSAKNVVGGTIDWEKVKRLPLWLHEELYARLKPRRNDLLLAKNGTTGIAALVDRDEVFDIYVSLALLRPTDKILPKYLLRVVNSPDVTKQFTGALKGIGVPNLHLKDIRKAQIPLPPLAEQKRIAAILDAADALRVKRREALAQLDALLQSTFLTLFGDPVTNPMEWPVVTIGDLLVSTAYGTSTKAHEEESGFPCLRMNNITYAGGWDFKSLKYVDLKPKEVPKNTVHKGQILFNRTNSKELVGKTAVYRREEPMAFAGYLVRGIANGEADAEYISAFLNLPQGKAILLGMCKSIVGMANINAQEFKSISLPKPPLTLQRRFAAIVESVERQKVVHRAHLAELDALFAALQHRAFRGEL